VPVQKRIYFLIALLVLTSCTSLPLVEEKTNEITGDVVGEGIEVTVNVEDTITIANWNLHIFGKTKASNEELLQSYAEKIRQHDIIFVQEIRDSSATAFLALCALLDGYDCTASSRAGTTQSKEQYGIIYKNTIELLSITDYNPEYATVFERPPVQARFQIGAETLDIVNIHTDPDLVPQELEALDQLIQEEGNSMIIGDLNADCSYYKPAKEPDFDTWTWVIQDTEDTTVASTDCAYDRIILSDQLAPEVNGYGIDTNVTEEQSDHYLVWVELEK